MLLLVFSGASVFSFIGFSICEVFLGIPLLSNPELMDDFSNPEILPALRLLQVLQALGMLILPAAMYLWISTSWDNMKQMFAHPKRQPFLISIAFFMVAFPVVNFLAELNSMVEIPTVIGDWMYSKEEKASTLTSMFLDMPTVWLLLFNLLMIAILPALGEELIFRGILQPAFQKLTGNPHVAIWVTAAIFSAIHLQFFGFVPRMLMGVALGYLFFWSGNLWYPIIAHLTNNGLSVVLAYGIQNGAVNPEIEFAGIDNLGLAGFSLLFCVMLLYLFKQVTNSRNVTA